MKQYRFDIVVKEGRYKGKIIESGFTKSRKEAIEKSKQSLIDAGLHLEAADIVFVKNYKVKLWEV